MFEITPEEFQLPFFKEQGFTRHKCVNCGSHFWSKNPDQQTCGEVPCQQYTFIGNPPTKRSYDIREMRAQFLDFFAQRGHKRIKPYPIVARWRDDVYLVGASIYDFQPYVTEGITPPPGNPLVISQPCIRFTDIDQVGHTAGRHMTTFEMGGHHAFNYPDREVYWKDETVRYHHELLTETLEVPGEMVTYKEHFWSGGGNAGPDLEGIVGGLEISTLVFMKFKVEGEELKPTSVRTVDTGYGIERWTWMSQGSPSGFHATFGPFLSYLLELAKLEIPETLASAITRAIGGHNSNSQSWRGLEKPVSQNTGLDVWKVQEAMTDLEAAYALADHSKAACFLLADGVVPSNIGEGYLARLIIRRTVRLARQLGITQMLSDIMEAQIRHWGPDFPLLRDMRHEILEGFQIETRKYQDTLARGSEIVVRLTKQLASEGVHTISTDQLVQLYDSHGLHPEIVSEGAEKLGVRVDTPDNFLSLVAGRHSRPRTDATEQKSEWIDKLQDVPQTRTLYYDDAYETSFTAKILARPTERTVVLDQTCFYPQGGGQPGDQGKLLLGEFSVKVEDVQKYGGTIVHFLDGPVSSGVELVKGEIDWGRRQSLMRHHTATHALLGAARRVLGNHVWQAGAQKDVETSRLDITHHSGITGKERDRIERLVNEVVLRNIRVQIGWLAREKAEAKYGFRLYQGGAVPGSKIRVVRIPGWDVEACGGTHCRRTGELGVFKIVKTDRLQDGVERMVFSAGESALRQVRKQEEIVAKASEALGVPAERLPDAVKSLVMEREKLSKELRKLREGELRSKVRRLVRGAKILGPVRLVVTREPRRKDAGAVELANLLKENAPDIVAVVFEVSDRVQVMAAAGDSAVGAGVNAGEIVSAVSRILGGGGGGRPFFATGGGPEKGSLGKAMAEAEQLVTRQLAANRAQRVA